jgi:formylglycine-generating enzyme required for sulfatase activity
MRFTIAAILTVSAGVVGAPPEAPHFPFDAGQAIIYREEWAKAARVDQEVINSIGAKLLLVPPGRFDMGPNGSKYRVSLPRPYYLGATEVTLGQYRKYKPDHKVEGAADEFNGDDYPAAMVSWNEARAYCDWLTAQPAEKASGRIYALPTEAQWEWAARAGSGTTRYFGDADKAQISYSWFNAAGTPNPKHEHDNRGRQPVARLRANAWGFHDMLGNVWEWCADRHVDPNTGEQRDPVMRGGSWRSGSFHCTAVAHDPGDANSRADNIGFRICCRVPERP